MIEIHWGEPLSLVVSPQGDVKKISTIEQASYWLRKKWPMDDVARDRAIDQLDAAMDCLVPVANARRAFFTAAMTAGFTPAGYSACAEAA